MADKVQAIPAGFHTLTPHLTVRDADKALEFYKNALGAEVLGAARMPDGRIMHAALRVGEHRRVPGAPVDLGGAVGAR